MNQHTVFEATRKAAETPINFTRKVMEQSLRLRHPSPRAAKIGNAIGSIVGAALLLAGTVQIIAGKPSWAVGTFSAGVLTVLSNIVYRRNYRK